MKRARVLILGVVLVVTLFSYSAAQTYEGSISPLSCFDSYFIIDGNGDLYGWGSNQWGTNFSADTFGPEAFIASDMVSVASGQWAAFAVDSKGELWGWGSSLFDLLPEDFAGVPVRFLDSVKAVACGSKHGLALKTDGTLWGWGNNDTFQMAGKTRESSVSASAPIQILSNVVSITANGDATYALTKDGTLLGWGGDVVVENESDTIAFPTVILNSVKAASATPKGLLVIKSDDTLWAKGDTALFADEGCTYNSFTMLLDSVAFCSPGIAIQKDGSLWTWGDNHSGQLADNTPNHRCTPLKVADGVLYAETGLNATMAITDTGELIMAGSAYFPGEETSASGFLTISKNVMLPSTAASIQCIPYTDVSEFDWFYRYAKKCLEMGLLKGVGNNQFAPALKITEEQAVTIAVRLSAQLTGRVLPASNGGSWYESFREYAIDNRILLPDELGNESSPISRYRFIELLSRVLQQKDFPAIRTSSIPDVDSSTALGAFISGLYQAGVLNGIDSSGAFYGEKEITRAEVAAVLSRIADPDLRIHI